MSRWIAALMERESEQGRALNGAQQELATKLQRLEPSNVNRTFPGQS